MQKAERLQTITKLVSTTAVKRQEELLGLLNRSGYSVTQASVSRDLDELGITKVDGRYTLPTTRIDTEGTRTLRLQRAGDNLIVAKCAPGMASAAAVRIDGLNLTEIVGTIAGDDTIFIAVADASDQKTVIKTIMEIF
jgi:transcriptional regulator of arginine metabolism